MINQRRFERALQYVRRTDVHTWLNDQIRPTAAGRKRALRVDVLLAGMLLAADTRPQLSQVAVHELLTIGLSRPVQERWGIRRGDQPITLRQVRYLWNSITNLFEHTQARHLHMPENEQQRRAAQLNELLDRLCGSAGMYLTPAASFAIDQTAIESAARGKRSNAAMAEALQEATLSEFGLNPDINPKYMDCDARWGYGTKTYDNKTDTKFGYQMNAFTRVPQVNGPDVPLLTDRIRVVPGNQVGIPETIAVLRDYSETDHPIREVLVDRGISNTVVEDWANPLSQLGIPQVVDHRSDDYKPYAIPESGVVMIAGWPHVPGIPDRLREDHPRPSLRALAHPPRHATAQERADYQNARAELAAYDAFIAERQQYAFSFHGVTKSGARRFRSPGHMMRVRCVGNPDSLALTGVPDCVHPTGTIPKCCSQQTITIPRAAESKHAQELYHGSPEWRASYSRRGRVEATFGNLKAAKNGLSIRRGWTRQFGLVKTTFLLGIAVAAENLKRLLDWAKRTGNTSDPLTRIDVTDHGHVELDADGNLITEAVPITDSPPGL